MATRTRTLRCVQPVGLTPSAIVRVRGSGTAVFNQPMSAEFTPAGGLESGYAVDCSWDDTWDNPVVYFDPGDGSLLIQDVDLVSVAPVATADSPGITTLLARVPNGDLSTWATRALTMIEVDGVVYRYTTNALEQAPAGGGGGGGGLTTDQSDKLDRVHIGIQSIRNN